MLYFALILFTVLLVIKLTARKDLSWWWVTSPLWIMGIIYLCTVIYLVAIVGCLAAAGAII